MEQSDDPKLVADPVLHAVLDHVGTIRGEAEQLAGNRSRGAGQGGSGVGIG